VGLGGWWGFTRKGVLYLFFSTLLGIVGRFGPSVREKD
jgi:hypothetical protein